MSAWLDSTDLEKVKYGNGMTFGFTDDGMVFAIIDTKLPDNRPVQLQQLWDPDRAEAVADAIKNAAIEARARKGAVVVNDREKQLVQ